MSKPEWMLTVDPKLHTQITEKLGKMGQTGSPREEKLHPRDSKKSKTTRYIRARARLPTGTAEKANYELPDWVTDEKFRDMMLVVMKSIANTQQRMRVLEAVIADNFMVPSTNKAVVAGAAMAETYYQKAMTQEGSELGAPAPQILFAFSEALYKQCDVGEEARAQIKKNIMDKMTRIPSHRCTEVVAFFTLKPCHDPSLHKVILVTQDVEVRATLVKALTNITGVKHFTAPAPASGQEDEVQKWIEKLESVRTF